MQRLNTPPPPIDFGASVFSETLPLFWFKNEENTCSKQFVPPDFPPANFNFIPS